MKSLASFAALAAEMTAMATRIEHGQHEALEAAAKVIETEAKDVIGTYRYGWPQLAEATQAARAAAGHSPNDPLLVKGELRESITHKVVDSRNAYVGSNSDIAVYQELGTKKIPPRSFLLGAATHKEREVQQLMGRKVYTKLIEG